MLRAVCGQTKVLRAVCGVCGQTKVLRAVCGECGQTKVLRVVCGQTKVLRAVYGVCVQIALSLKDGIGISLVNSLPEELVYITLRNIQVEITSRTSQLTVNASVAEVKVRTWLRCTLFVFNGATVANFIVNGAMQCTVVTLSVGQYLPVCIVVTLSVGQYLLVYTVVALSVGQYLQHLCVGRFRWGC